MRNFIPGIASTIAAEEMTYFFLLELQLGGATVRYNDSDIQIIHEGETVTHGDVSLTGVYADHGDLAPEALGVVVQSGDIRVWQVADTAYRPERWQDVFSLGIDVIIPPINGAYGNLNGEEAARLAALTGAKIIIPTHFWTFVEHRSDPYAFAEYCRTYVPNAEVRWMTQGEGTLIPCAL